MRVLTINAGSSSLKVRLLGPADEVLATRDLPAERGRLAAGALETVLAELDTPDVIAHRVVHGGPRYSGPVLLDDAVLTELERLVDLAPLHQLSALAMIRATARCRPGTPAVACFDTAFHAAMPDVASTYAIPARWRHELGVRRYGFHGLAHEWAAQRARELLGPVERIVVAHLGSGASLCAVRHGRSVDTTMGFTPTAGLVMGTRCGDLDPAVPLWLVQRGLAVDDVNRAIEHQSGLAALAGTADMKAVLALETGGDPDATLAVGVWLHRLRAGIAAMVSALGGIDALVFSGGVGEHSPELRRRALDSLGFLGLALDNPRNTAAAGCGVDSEVGSVGGPVRVLVVHAREDLVMARHARTVLGDVLTC